MENNISSERFILSGWNLPYKEVFTRIAENFHKKPPHKKVTPWLAAIVWRLEAVKAMFTGKDPLLTKETAKTAAAKVNFDNRKITRYFLNFEYGMIALAFAVGSYSLYHGRKKHHHNRVPLILFSIGIALLLAKVAWHEWRLWLLVPAVSCIVTAHILNYRLCRVYDHEHSEF